MRIDNPLFQPGSLNTVVSSSYALTAGRIITELVTITGTTTNPTKGPVTVDRIILTDDGSGLCLLTMNFSQTAGGTGGSGDYLFTLPGGYQFDTTYHTARAVTGDPGLAGTTAYIPGARGQLAGTTSNLIADALPMVWDATRFRLLMGAEILFGTSTAIRTPIGSAFFTMSNQAGYQASFIFRKA